MPTIALPASRQLRLILTGLLVALLAGTALAAPAGAKRRLAFGGMGMNLRPEVVQTLSSSALDREMGVMASSGVESVRTDFSWDGANPAPGKYTWGLTDKLVHAAALRGLELLPVVQYTPRWASTHPGSHFYNHFAPKSYATYGTFLKAAIKRYGPKGRYWKLHPKLPRHPIRVWGLWNEPSQPFPWQTRPWAPSYVKLLKAGYKAVHAADHGAKVLAAALSGHGPIKGSPTEQAGVPVWGDIAQLYRAGGRKYFDIISMNFYTNAGGISFKESVDREFRAASLVRAEMAKHGDKKKPIWLTEVTWLSSLGHVPASNYTGATAFEPVPTSQAGQAVRLVALYNRLASKKRTYGITRAYWVTWGSSYGIKKEQGGFDYAGLNAWVIGQAFQPKPLLTSYRTVAAKLEGCRKTTSARHCR